MCRRSFLQVWSHIPCIHAEAVIISIIANNWHGSIRTKVWFLIILAWIEYHYVQGPTCFFTLRCSMHTTSVLINIHCMKILSLNPGNIAMHWTFLSKYNPYDFTLAYLCLIILQMLLEYFLITKICWYQWLYRPIIRYFHKQISLDKLIILNKQSFFNNKLLRDVNLSNFHQMWYKCILICCFGIPT